MASRDPLSFVRLNSGAVCLSFSVAGHAIASPSPRVTTAWGFLLFQQTASAERPPWVRAARRSTQRLCLPSAQIWFGTRGIHASEDLGVDFLPQGHPQTTLRYTVSGEAIFAGEMKERVGKSVETKRVRLRKGWNAGGFRGYCVGDPPFRAGLVISGTPEQRWKLSLSARPPEGNRRSVRRSNVFLVGRGPSDRVSPWSSTRCGATGSGSGACGC